MLREYALDPEVAAASNPSFLTLSNLFGFDRGRVISRFPGNWVKHAINAVNEAEEIGDLQKHKLVEAIARAKEDKMVRSGRPFNPGLPDWLSSCREEHIKNPFDAIIVAENNGGGAEVISAEDATDESHPLVIAKRDAVIEATGAAIATTLNFYFRSCRELYFHDKYFQLNNPKYRDTLGACLAEVPYEKRGEIQCQIHSCEGRVAPPRQFQKDIVGKLIPDGISIEWFHWKEKEDGKKFHDRYLLTEVGGVSLGAGFSSEGAHQNVNVQLLGPSVYETARESIDKGSHVYELLEAFRILSDGTIEEI